MRKRLRFHVMVDIGHGTYHPRDLSFFIVNRSNLSVRLRQLVKENMGRCLDPQMSRTPYPGPLLESGRTRRYVSISEWLL